jgi:hypothetical protein
MSDNLLSYAKSEMELAGVTHPEADYGDLIPKSVIELIEVFSKQGHSGGSAPIVIRLFSRLASFEPLTLITGSDEEWVDVADGIFQNKRLSTLFKTSADPKPYFLDAIVWMEPDGNQFTGTVAGIHSRQYVKLPFTPKTFYVDIDHKRNIIDKATLREAHQYYNGQPLKF